MADVFSKEKRSEVMSKIRGKDTKPEILVRKYLHSRGLRFRKNDKRYPGHPDIVLPKYKTIVLVHGCFWHLHEGCKYARIPKSNVEYWQNKLYGNKERDKRTKKELEDMGWKSIFKDFYPINKYYQFLKIPISYMKNSFFDAKSFNICKK